MEPYGGLKLYKLIKEEIPRNAISRNKSVLNKRLDISHTQDQVLAKQGYGSYSDHSAISVGSKGISLHFYGNSGIYSRTE